MFDLKESKLKGCFEILPKVLDDNRGRFVKTFHYNEFISLDLETNFVEEYYSVSTKNVIRGMHFQLPPMDHVKLVYCIEGDVQDVVVDLRVDSPTFGQYEIFELSASKANGVYIPKGLAHGFCAKTELAILIYKVSAIYNSNLDTGIRWNSINIPWHTNTPILSVRDLELPKFEDFTSPFVYDI